MVQNSLSEILRINKLGLETTCFKILKPNLIRDKSNQFLKKITSSCTFLQSLHKLDLTFDTPFRNHSYRHNTDLELLFFHQIKRQASSIIKETLLLCSSELAFDNTSSKFFKSMQKSYQSLLNAFR